MKKSPSITVIIHTKNEEHNILDCIHSCQKLATEILVVDMHSSDETVAIAKKAGATILKVPDVGYVEPARQQAIEKAKGDWIFILDADERLSPTLINRVRLFATNGEGEVLQIPEKNIILGKWIDHGMGWPDHHYRFFKKGSVHWPAKIHSQPELTGTVVQLPADEKFAIIHYYALTVKEIMEKTFRYASSETFYDEQKEVSLDLFENRMNHEIPWRFIEHEGWKDGIEGLICAKFMEYYRFLEFAVYCEKMGFPEKFSQEVIERFKKKDSLSSKLRHRISKLFPI